MEKINFQKEMKKNITSSKKIKEMSNRLEFLLVSNDTIPEELAEFIGINYPNFSRIRSAARRGELPSLKFLLGISNYYKENFFSYLLNFIE